KFDNPLPDPYVLVKKGNYSHDHRLSRSFDAQELVPSEVAEIDFRSRRLVRAAGRGRRDITVFGNNWIRSPDGGDPLMVVKQFNEHAAELTAKYPKRLLGLACSVPFGDDAILKETEKAIKQYKLKGIMVNSSVNGEYLDSPRATPFFQLVTELDVPLFVHPPKFTIGNEKME